MNREDIFAVVKKHAIETIGEIDESKFDPDFSLSDLGASSLDIVDIMSRVMSELKIKVPRKELMQLTNVNGLVDLFHQHALAQATA